MEWQQRRATDLLRIRHDGIAAICLATIPTMPDVIARLLASYDTGPCIVHYQFENSICIFERTTLEWRAEQTQAWFDRKETKALDLVRSARIVHAIGPFSSAVRLKFVVPTDAKSCTTNAVASATDAKSSEADAPTAAIVRITVVIPVIGCFGSFGVIQKRPCGAPGANQEWSYTGKHDWDDSGLFLSWGAEHKLEIAAHFRGARGWPPHLRRHNHAEWKRLRQERGMLLQHNLFAVPASESWMAVPSVPRQPQKLGKFAALRDCFIAISFVSDR